MTAALVASLLVLTDLGTHPGDFALVHICNAMTRTLNQSINQHTLQQHKTFPKPISWLGMEKLNLSQQKHTFTNQKKALRQKIN